MIYSDLTGLDASAFHANTPQTGMCERVFTKEISQTVIFPY